LSHATPSSLAELGWDDDWAAAYAAASADQLPAARPARIIRVDLGECTALADGGLPMRVATGHDSRVAVGDWIVVVPGIHTDDLPRLHAVLPRRSAFSRASAGAETREQVVAANTDTVLLVSGLDPPVSVRRMERYLALGWQSGASPAIVLTKADLVAPDDLTEQVAAVNAVALGVPVYVVSAADDVGLDALRAHVLPGQTVALLGPSGAGKSTLVNRLAGVDLQVIGEVRRDGKGRHTTTHRELIPLPDGGLVLDTPGMRGLGLWDAEEGMEQAFADVEALLGLCRFSDCAHEREPGCEVQAAVADGRLDSARFESWRKLQHELQHQASRQDARLRAEKLRQWKTTTKAYRKRPHR
jgi:ribosome biogenesis GTPase